MNISFDLDSCLVNLSVPIKKLCKKLNFKYVPAKNWEMTNYPDNIRKSLFDMFKIPEIMCNLKPLPFAKQIIKKLVKQGHTVTIITARYIRIKEETIDYVQNMFKVPCFVVGQNKSKLEIMKQVGTQIWIDDSPCQTLEYMNNGINCIMISTKDTVYNHYLRNKVEWYPNLKLVYKSILNK